MSSPDKKPRFARLGRVFETVSGVVTAAVYIRGCSSPARGFAEGRKAARALIDHLQGKEPEPVAKKKSPKKPSND